MKDILARGGTEVPLRSQTPCPERSNGMSPPIRILYVDDSALDRELVRDMLEKEHGGFAVTEVGSREELERCLDNPSYDLLLTDFNILGFDGLQVFDLVQERIPGLPVIILTRTGSEDVAVEAMRRGASDYVVKNTAHINRLPQTIENVLEKQRLQEEREKTRRALVESQKSLELAVEGADLGLWDWNIQNGEAVWSERATKIFDLPEGENVPALPACKNLTHPDDWPKVSDRLNQHLAGVTQAFEVEFRVKGKAGQWQWVYVRGKSVKTDQDGNTLRMAGTIIDVTPRKAAEVELAKTLEDLKRAQTETEALLEASKTLLEVGSFESAAARIFNCCKRVIGCDAGYVAILWENSQESEILYLDPGNDACTVAPGVPMPLRGLTGVAVRSGRPVFDNNFLDSQSNSLLPPGHVKLESVLFAPLTIQGSVVGLLGIANKEGGFNEHDADLARAFAEFSAIGLLRARSGKALEESAVKYRTLIDALPISVAIVQDEKLAFINRAGAQMVACDDPQEIVGQDARRFLSDKEKEAFSDFTRRRRQGDPSMPKHYTSELARCNGDTFPAEIFVETITFEGGPAEQIIAIDISDRRRLEEQLRHSQKMEAVGTLAGGIAHDFNNLLQIISGHAELLSLELGDRNQGAPELRAIIYSAERGAELVNNILTFSRRVEPSFQVMDLNQEVQVAERILYRTIPKMIELELRLQEPLMAIEADKSQIEQMLLNLALNAKDAMPEGGKLTFETRNVHLNEDYCTSHVDLSQGDYVLLHVRDTGKGMDKETMSHIFDPFYTTKKPGEGTGLGLSTVFGIVKMHHGHIICYSEPGSGTSFKIYFPAAQTESGHEKKRKDVLPLNGTETILVVDDEELIAALAKRILEKSGYHVLTAGSGKEAVEVYSKEREEIALVILDLIMPEMGGKQCLEELLKINPKIKALIASGFAIDGDTKAFLNSAETVTVSKPFKVREMLQAVRKVLDEDVNCES